MAKLSVKEIRERALGILAERPGGMRKRDLAQLIHEADPETALGTVNNTINELLEKFPGRVVRQERGVFSLADGPIIKPPPEPPVCHESEYYPGFAQWLQDDLDEVTIAAPLGGAGLGRKWGTPDVVGVYKAMPWDLIKFGSEIVSAEIKTDPQQPVVAFGQAIAYRLFSSKAYIAMPNSMSEEDKGRLESLCVLFGVGLVLFELSPEKPEFAIRVRAQKFAPDMFYVNKFAEDLKKHDEDVFKKLFG